MGKKPVNAIKGQQGFQKTGRTERGKDAPTAGAGIPSRDTTGSGTATGNYEAAYRHFSSQSVDDANVVGTGFVRVLQSGGTEDPNWVPEEQDREALVGYAMTEQGRDDCEFAISSVGAGVAIHEGHAENEPEKADLHLRRAQASRNVAGALQRLLTEADERVNAERVGRGLPPLTHPPGATGCG